MKLNMDFVRAIIAEFAASTMFISLGCFGTTNTWIFSSDNFHRSANWGIAALAAIQSFGCVSGAHLQPCVSIAAMIVQVVDVVTGLCYILAQLLGTLFGYSIAYFLTKDHSVCFCCTIPGVEDWKACLCEFYITSTWIFAVLTSWRSENENLLETISIRIGFTVAGCVIAGEYFSGASMNPFRSLIAAIFSNYFGHVWIYAAVPPLSAIFIAVVFRFIYNEGNAKNQEEPAE